MRHIRDVLCGRKDCFERRVVRVARVPNTDVFSVNNVYKMIKHNPRYMAFVPSFNEEKYDAEDVFERQWFFDLLKTIDL